MQVTITATFTATDGEEVEEVQKVYDFDLEDTGEVNVNYGIVADYDSDEDTITVRHHEIKVD